MPQVPLTWLLLEFMVEFSLGLGMVSFSLSFALDSVISGLSPAAMAAAAATSATAPAPLWTPGISESEG